MALNPKDSVYTFVWGDGMRTRPAWALLAAAALAFAALGGCAREAGTAEGEDLPEQRGLAVGSEAPEFRLKNQDQETVALSDYRGTSNVVLVFYPADFTPV